MAVQPKRERGDIDDAVSILGRKKRIIQAKAAMGKIPGAVKLWGRWTFDLELLGAMVHDEGKWQWAENIRKHQAAVFGAARPSTVGLASRVASSSGRFTQVTRRLRQNAGRRARTA